MFAKCVVKVRCSNHGVITDLLRHKGRSRQVEWLPHNSNVHSLKILKFGGGICNALVLQYFGIKTQYANV